MNTDTTKRGIFSYFITSYRVTFLIIAGLGLFGAFSLVTLPRESTPEIEIPVGIVITPYPGASAIDVEELVTKPIEDEIENLEGVDTYTSASSLGISSITVEFLPDEDTDEALRRLRESVADVTDLPSQAEDPEVREVRLEDEPIISIGLTGVEDQRVLTLHAQDIAEQIENVPGVSRVDVVGERKQHVAVNIDPIDLERRGLSIGQIIATIQATNANVPFGQLETDAFAYDLRILGRYENVGDVAKTAIPLADGESVTLGEIADISLEVEEQKSGSRISIDGQPSAPAVTLNVRKKTGGNIIDIVDESVAIATQFQERELPDNINIITFADRADEIRTSLRNVTQSGLQTLVIVFGILWLFLGWKEALIASLAVPFTFFMSFIVFGGTDVTLNSISLFSLILSLGLLVDTAIVIVEGVHKHRNDSDLRASAASVVKQFQKPLAAGVLTTVAAFFPMLLVSGIIGQFLRTIPIVLSATLLSSLFVALALLPAVAVGILTRWPSVHANKWFTRKFNALSSWYEQFIERALRSRSFQKKFIWALSLLMLAGLSLPFTGLLRTGLFPEVDVDFILGNVELPPGSRLEETNAILSDIENDLRDVPEIKSFVLNAGTGTSTDIVSGGGSSSENIGSFYINLNKDRERSSIAITEELRSRFSQETRATVELTEISAGPPTAAPIELRVTGENLDDLDTASQQIMDELKNIPGAVEIDRNLRFSAGEFNFRILEDEIAKRKGSSLEVAQTLRTLIFGTEATTFLDKTREEIPVDVSAQDQTVNSIDAINEIPFRTQSGDTVRIGQIADVQLSTSISTIRHKDGDRAITISANAADTYNPNQIAQELQTNVANRSLPTGVAVEFGGEQQETEETFADLYRSMGIAVIAIAAILVIEFNSYRQPFIIILSIPLALIGVLFGLLVLGGQLNFASFIGLVSLTGIVVNNAILLVDRMNAYRSRGENIRESAAKAANSRLRPIILTTLTTAAGVAPLIWVDEFFRDLALTLISGLLFSAVLTLVLIPILYVRQQEKLTSRSFSQRRANDHVQFIGSRRGEAVEDTPRF